MTSPAQEYKLSLFTFFSSTRAIRNSTGSWKDNEVGTKFLENNDDRLGIKDNAGAWGFQSADT